MRRFSRARVAALVVAAVLTVALVAPCSALAIAGGSRDTAVSATLPFHMTGDLVADPSGLYVYWLVFPMTTGKTIDMTITAGPGEFIMGAVGSPDWDDPWMPWPEYVSKTVEHLNVMAAHTDNYYLQMLALDSAHFSVDATFAPTTKFTVSAVRAPSKKSHKKSFTASVTLRPGYNGGMIPIRFFVERKRGGKWKVYKSKAARLVGKTFNVTYTTASASFKLPKGKYRLRARFWDCAHAKTFTKYKSFKSK